MNNSAPIPLIPRSVLFGNPEKTQPQLSPDGKKMAYNAPLEGVMNIWVRTIGADDARPVTRSTERGIPGYMWAADNTHIIYVQDAGGDENYRLYSVNLESGEIRDLTPFEDVKTGLLAHSKNFPDDLLITMNKDNPQLNDVYRLHLPDAGLTRVAANPGNVVGWAADHDFKVRGAFAVRPDGGRELQVRDSEESEWRTLIAWGPEDLISGSLLQFTADGESVYFIDSRSTDTSRVLEMDIRTGEFRVVAEDPEHDVAMMETNPDTHVMEAVGFQRARFEWVVLDDAVRDDFETLATLHHGDFSVISRDDADRTWLVDYVADNGPVAYYSYDRSTRTGTHLFESRPELRSYTLASMEPISFVSRDGLTIHGYITFPPGEERRNLPMVLNVHGGPWARDSWGYNSEAQWLANRGYICLQVNYRGSIGYGKRFMNAGNREWGGKMHDDLVDAVTWAVEKGYADPGRVAIYGGSYGGYASLVGATFTPDLFRCAVAIVGPSNLVTFIDTIPEYWKPMIAQFHLRVGNPETEAEFLLSRSPITRVDRIRIPMLIAQGANDPRVKQSESEQIVEAMRSKGIDHDYLLFPDEGHGFARPENRMKFYSAAERFLAEHLGGRCEEP